MKRRSWIILAISVLLLLGLVTAYIMTQNGSEKLTQEDAIGMTQKMEAAFRRKNANAILEFISPAPGTRVANVSQDQFRLLLVRYFRNSDHLSAELNHYAFTSSDADAALQFDLVVHNDGADSRNQDYTGHIILHFKRVEVPHLFGLYQTKEWRIAAAESSGADISTFGD